MNVDQGLINHKSASAELRLIVVAGRHLGAEMELPLPLGRSIFIGSHLNCDLVISDQGVTASHAVVFEENGCLWVKSVPGGGESSVSGKISLQNAIKLEQDMVLCVGSSASIKVQGNSLPAANSVDSVISPSLSNSRKPVSRLRAFTALGCIAFSAVVAAVSLGTNASASRISAQLVAASVVGVAKRPLGEIQPNLLESAARQVDRYLGDPGVKVTARPPNRIEVAGAARSLATRTQLKKIQVVLPNGVEIFETLSYPEDKVVKNSAPSLEQPLAKLAKKVLQVASSEKAPFIEVEGGTRIFEGGQLNGFELLKITPGVIVARRDNQIETFKVE